MLRVRGAGSQQARGCSLLDLRFRFHLGCCRRRVRASRCRCSRCGCFFLCCLLLVRRLLFFLLPTVRAQPLAARLRVQTHARKMKPFRLAVRVVARHHCAEANFLADAVHRLTLTARGARCASRATRTSSASGTGTSRSSSSSGAACPTRCSCSACYCRC